MFEFFEFMEKTLFNLNLNEEITVPAEVSHSNFTFKTSALLRNI